jgi:hypothetical protein
MRVMIEVGVWLEDRLWTMEYEFTDRPATVMLWRSLAGGADNASYSQAYRDQCSAELKHSVDRTYYDRPVTREEVIEAFDYARQHSPNYAGTEDDLLAMLADFDDDETPTYFWT